MPRSTPTPTPSRPPGRPAADRAGDAREELLEAAGRLFARDGMGQTSLRQVADEAGVTPAMVHYYFGGKEGLYEALLERTFSTLLQEVGAVATEPAAPGDDRDRLARLLEVVTSTMAEKAWVPALVIREVLAEGGRLREDFIQSYAKKTATLLPGLVQSEIAEGRFRADLDPRLAFLSFMGMAIFPFVARPVVEGALGIDYDADFLQRFVAHTHRLFLEGTRP